MTTPLRWGYDAIKTKQKNKSIKTAMKLNKEKAYKQQWNKKNGERIVGDANNA